MSDEHNAIRLSLPATQDCALVARMALSGVGVLAGLDVDTIGDLRTVAGECVDCLAHQPSRPRRVAMEAWLSDGRLRICFEAEERGERLDEPPLSLVVTRGVLETLMPEVDIQSDEGGVCRILCSMPV